MNFNYKLIRNKDEQLIGESKETNPRDAARAILQHYFILHSIREISLNKVMISSIDKNTFKVAFENEDYTLHRIN